MYSSYKLPLILLFALSFGLSKPLLGQLYQGVDVTNLSSEYVFQQCQGIRPSPDNPEEFDFIVSGDNQTPGMRYSNRLALGSYVNEEVLWPGYSLFTSSWRGYPSTSHAFKVVNLQSRIYSQMLASDAKTGFLFYNLNDTSQNHELYHFGTGPISQEPQYINGKVYFLVAPCNGIDEVTGYLDYFGLDNDSLHLVEFNPQTSETDTIQTFLNVFDRGPDYRDYWGNIKLDFDKQQLQYLSEDTLLTYNFNALLPVDTTIIPLGFFVNFHDHYQPTVQMLSDTIYRSLYLANEGDLLAGIDFLGLERKYLSNGTLILDTIKFYLPAKIRDLPLAQGSLLSLFGPQPSGAWFGTINYYSDLSDSSQATALVKYNAQQEVLWQHTYFEDKERVQVNAIVEGRDASVYLGGYWEEELYMPLNSWANDKVISTPFVRRLGADGYPQTPLPEDDISVYPNPVTYGLRIISEKSQRYRIYSAGGILMQEGPLNTVEAKQDIVVQNLNAGIYTLVIEKQDGTMVRTKFYKQAR